jgi:hypothetical protein
MLRDIRCPSNTLRNFSKCFYNRIFSNGFCIVENSPKSEIKHKFLKKLKKKDFGGFQSPEVRKQKG